MEALCGTASEMLAVREQKRLKRHYLLEALTFGVLKIRKCREISKLRSVAIAFRRRGIYFWLGTAAQYVSNNFVSIPAISCASLISMSYRWIIFSSFPSRMNANDGEEGGMPVK